jgi:beta-lactamase class A
MNQGNFSRVILYLGGALLLFALGWQAHTWYQRHSIHQEHRRVKQAGFKYTSPLLDVELPEGYRVNSEPIPFKYKIKAFVEKQIQSGQVADMAVYYRDLSDGPWFGINEKVPFNPASMMKVPVMVAWLKRAEKNPTILKKTFLFKEEYYTDKPQFTKPAQSLTSGASYTVEELLRYMVSYSDNKATWVLFNALNPEETSAVLDGMDVANDPSGDNNSISAHGYSGFFRILYNASYLNREMSEKALQLLSYEDFHQGIAAGIPKGVTVATKFGEDITDRDIQLHEFGIVYHPQGPYILGVMTRGQDFTRQAEIISRVSAMIYNEIASSANVPSK